jgi:elongation factor Tu
MPRIRTQLEMKRQEEGGRHAPFWENYRPHLIPVGTEDYLGVTVVNLSEEQGVAPGTSATVEFDLVYHPNVDYSGLSVGTAFEIREGARVVGTGKVLEQIA